MKLFVGRDFSELYYEMLEFALSENVSLTDSRVGRVKDFGCAYYELHAEDSRLTYLIGRNLNPFFALAEFAWIINGSKALKPLQFFIKAYGRYSDDGETLHGGYGFRLRHYFGCDQIEASVQLLRNDPTSRRVVLTLWSADDLAANSKDLPCNTAVYLKIRNEALDITVLNRSNDLYLGVPHDILVFYLLQLHIADRIGSKVGVQRHFVDSFHLYEANFVDVKNILNSNNKFGLSVAGLGLAEYDFKQFIRTNTDRITALDFTAIKDRTTRDFFKSYAAFEAGTDFKQAIDLLPKCTLGYVAYLWYRSRKGFPEHLRFEPFEELIRRQS
jgi:thymidylate synthase